MAGKSPLTSFVIQPTRVVWTSEQGVENSANLLKPHSGQAVLSEPVPPLVIKPGGALVLDFGREIAGSVELFTPMTQARTPRSASASGNPWRKPWRNSASAAHRTITPCATRS